MIGWIFVGLMIAMIISQMAVTTTTSLADLIQEKIGEALLAVREQNLFAPGSPLHEFLDVADLTASGGDSADFNTWSSLTAHDVVEGEDYTDVQSMTPTSVNVPSVEKQIITWISKKAMRALSSPGAEARRAAQEAEEHARAHSEKWDVAVMKLFKTLTVGKNHTGAALIVADLKTAVKAARAAKLPKPWVGLLSEEQWDDLVTESSSPLADAAVSGPAIGGELWRNYQIKELLGVTWFISTLIYNDATDDFGAILGRNAIGATIKLWPPEVSTEYDQSRRATEVSSVPDFDVKVVRATRGFYIQSSYT